MTADYRYRVHRAVRGRDRRAVRLAPLADLGQPQIKTFLTQQRDLYAYLHDQTLRLLNQGYTGLEIAEMMELPPALERAWNTRGYYGSVSHNVKSVYQHYMSWFDGNPAHLWELPPVDAAKKHVEYMGGAAAVIEKVKADDGSPRWGSRRLSTTRRTRSAAARSPAARCGACRSGSSGGSAADTSTGRRTCTTWPSSTRWRTARRREPLAAARRLTRSNRLLARTVTQ